MIDIYGITPQTYYDNSRDFQAIARVLEAMSNQCKTAADMVRNSPFDANIDVKLLYLLAKTIGFDNRHRYNDVEFKAICSSFVEIMRAKGTLRAIRKTIELFLTAKGVSDAYRLGYLTDGQTVDKTTLSVLIPAEIVDVTLLEDVFDYILPTGMNYVISFSVGDGDLNTYDVLHADYVNARTYANGNLGVITHKDSEKNVRPTYAESNDSLGLTFTGIMNRHDE